MTIVVVCLIQIITICLCVENDRDKTIIWLLYEQKQMKTAFSAIMLQDQHLSHSRQNFTDSPSTEIESFNVLSCLFWSDFILLICNRRMSRASTIRWIVPSSVSTAVPACHEENLTNQRVHRSFLFASLFLFHLSSNQISIDFHSITEKSSTLKKYFFLRLNYFYIHAYKQKLS